MAAGQQTLVLNPHVHDADMDALAHSFHLTQLLVPLALVTLSLWVSSLSIKSGNERPLVLSRSTALMGAPSVLAANASVRDEAGNLAAWGAAFPARLVDSGVNDTWQGGQTAGTLEVSE
jgi:hypothetical protein